MCDPERIWLQNADDAREAMDGRLWCQDKVWPGEPEDGEPTEYIRADLLSTARAEARREALEEAAKVASGWETNAADDAYMTCGNGNFWDPGTAYDQGRADAGAAIAYLIEKDRRSAALSELAAQDAELIEEPDPDLLRDDAHERRRMMKEYPDEE